MYEFMSAALRLQPRHIHSSLPAIMRVTLFILSLISTQLVNAQVLVDKLYFVNGLELFGLKQSNDTLYEFKCNASFQCQERIRKHYKIIESKDTLNWRLVKIERLDSIPLTTKPIREDRFKLWGFQRIDEGVFRVVTQRTRFTLDSIQLTPINSLLSKEKFGFTYYTEDFLTSLNTDYEIDSLTVDEIVSGFKNYEDLIQLYKNTDVVDFYGSGIAAELTAKELIKRGWSPLYGVERINVAMKPGNKR